MNGLPFENLPAQSQDPIGILQNKLGESERYLKSQYDSELSVLKNQFLTDEKFFGQLNSLYGKYQQLANQERFKVTQQVQSVERIKSLMGEGKISPEAGNEAMWRLVLPSETERAMFQTAQKGLTTPQRMSPSLEQSISGFADAAATKKLWWTAAENEPKTQESLFSQYTRWRDFENYDMQNPIVQRDLDKVWDLHMMGDEKFDVWWDNKRTRKPMGDVRISRTYGGVAGKIKRRVLGTPTIPGKSPFSKIFGGQRRAWEGLQSTQTQRQPTRIPQPRSEQEYNALPSGTTYIGTDGQRRTKR